MNFAKRAQSRFSSEVRRRGERYFRAAAVDVLEVGDDWAEFEVAGSHDYPYAVTLGWPGGKLTEWMCNCPFFAGGRNCKHIWAAILATDEQKLTLLGGNETSAESPQFIADRRRPATASSAWRKQLDNTASAYRLNAATARIAEPSPSAPQLVFRLTLQPHAETPLVQLYQGVPFSANAKDAIKPCVIDDPFSLSALQPEDRRIVAQLLGNLQSASTLDNRFANDPTGAYLNPELYGLSIPMLVETRRFYYLPPGQQSWNSARPVGWNDGPPWQFRLRAERDDVQRQWKVSGELRQGRRSRPLADGIAFYASGLLLIDDQLAWLDAPKDMRWLELLLREEALTIPFADRRELLEQLWRTGDGTSIVGDKELQVKGRLGVPQGLLTIHPPQPDAYRYAAYRQTQPLYASVTFSYGHFQTTPNSKPTARLEEETQTVTTANQAEEIRLMRSLLEMGLRPKAINHYGTTPPGHLELHAGDLDRIVERCIAAGWEVHAEGVRKRKSASLTLSVRSGVDWFDLAGEAKFDDVAVELPQLLEAIRSGERYVRLGDGSHGILPEEWRRKFAALADFSHDTEEKSLRYRTSQALLLDSLLTAAQLDSPVQVDRKFAKTRRQLQSFAGVKPAKPPAKFQGELRRYQQEGLGWLRFLEKFGFGGCLADDMGLGKTVQILALLSDRNRRQPKEADKRPSLVVAPNSVVHNWRQEAERFAPQLKVAEYVGKDRKKAFPDLREFDLILTTYGTLRKDFERMAVTAWDYAILDEAQAIKNSNSQTAKASRLLTARHRLALSGTPIENHLGELWSLFEFLNPGLLGSSRKFQGIHRNGGEIDEEKLETLRHGLTPFLLRRTKKEVLPQLPEKSEQRIYCDLPASQRKQYDQLREHYRKSLQQRIAESGMAKAKIHVLEALLRLRQAACHPGLIDPKQKDKPSAKLDLLLEQLDEVLQEGHKAIVFSQFTTMLDIVKRKLDAAEAPYEYLDGKTQNRQAKVARFQEDEDCRLFLISLKAGGTGLNLTAADFVFLLDPWWNPAVEAQAIDRAHRIGQTKPVFAYRLIARNTVEEKILELQSQKSRLAEAVISADSSLLKNLSAEDLQAILS